MQSLRYCREAANRQIARYYSVLADIELCERLHYFGDQGEFRRSFLVDLKWLFDTWTDEESEELFDAQRVSEIEDKLEQLPFKDAIRYKTPADEELANICLDEMAEWRLDVSSVMAMSKDDKIRIWGYFEYMCCFIINVREELLFDIQYSVLDEPELQELSRHEPSDESKSHSPVNIINSLLDSFLVNP